jgi:hypothetical protein
MVTKLRSLELAVSEVRARSEESAGGNRTAAYFAQAAEQGAKHTQRALRSKKKKCFSLPKGVSKAAGTH